MARNNSLRTFLDGEYSELKDKVRAHFDGNDLFRFRAGLSLKESRQLTNERTNYILQLPECQLHLIEQIQRKQHALEKCFAIGEITGISDISTNVKCAVVAWLVGGAIVSIGSDEAVKKWLKPSEGPLFRKETGMFAMSERAHGSNVRGILTEAHYLPHSQEFQIHTPSSDAEKMYIGNALNAQFAIVFAQLHINGECKGPHAFIVPVRDEEEVVNDGIVITDLGIKEGLNGVDNGMIRFTHVRIPRENMLNRYADVSVDGEYTTSIASNNARFNAMIGALLPTRVALCIQTIACMKLALEIAIRYAHTRRQFGGTADKPELLVMDYQTHQLRLMPFLASSVAITFASRYCASSLDADMFAGKEIVDNRSLQALAAGLKAYSTWETVQCLQVCRECTGGMGYLAENRIADLKADADAFVTFEGDNMVVIQQVAKELLAQYSKQFEGSQLLAAATTIKDNVLAYLKTSSIAVSTDSPTSVAFITKAMIFKEQKLLRMLAARLLYRINNQKEVAFEAWNDCLHHIVTLGTCHIERVALEQFVACNNKCENKENRAIVDRLCQLFAVNVMYNDRAWFLENHYITPAMASDLRDELLRLCREVRYDALAVVEAFAHPRICVHAPCAGIPSQAAPWLYCPSPDEELSSSNRLISKL